ncbi:developmentally-regulated GTP-binding protein, putative [Entamoeba invadens IP1]|uniref:developmentally-regulated GTP-binding protein, putative n=1 Tax=Entamoeba invadens IP1 TaxID=370355 RepID=UPI0002C3DDAA|nr:developmentally-regulated GTP-binding protein, putative [Entamoeba invadens IP1]ELP85231.1 developmentally-regulated GTP-binding protein, putative [Entamoeba invadens IP1]|eukprot:XP_004184577.1 developmentally-regulated GTP-binding protein, putative [Entamoeba invadens IP1]
MSNSIEQKIADIELEFSRTQVNKATMHHLCLLRAKLVKYKKELAPVQTRSQITGDLLQTIKYGDVRVGLIGFTGVGKSTLFSSINESDDTIKDNVLNGTKCVTGVLESDGMKIEILDLPGISEDSTRVKKNRAVYEIAKTCDLLMVILDATNEDEQTQIFEQLEANGFRLNKKKPDVRVVMKDRGGIYVSEGKNTKLDKTHLIQTLKSEFLVESCDVICGDDEITEDDVYDAMSGDVWYGPSITVMCKSDVLDEDTKEEKLNKEQTVCVSVEEDENIQKCVEMIWEKLGLIKTYLKSKSGDVDLDTPIVLMKSKATVELFCFKINRNLVNEMKYAMVWGTSVEHSPQRVNSDHMLDDDDVVQIAK